MGLEVLVDHRANFEAGGCCRRRDEVDDDLMGDERFSSPVLRDEGEEAVFNLVPFARAGREVANGDRNVQFVCEALQLDLPQSYA